MFRVHFGFASVTEDIRPRSAVLGCSPYGNGTEVLDVHVQQRETNGHEDEHTLRAAKEASNEHKV